MWHESWRKLKAKKNIVLETVHQARDGRIYPVEIRANYVEFGGREYDCAFARDITERQRAETALRESEERQRTILQTATDGFCRVNLQGRLLEVNDAYCRMSGYDEQELLALSISDLEVAETPADTAAHFRNIIARGEDRFETRHRRKDGAVFPSKSAPIPARERRVPGGLPERHHRAPASGGRRCGTRNICCPSRSGSATLEPGVWIWRPTPPPGPRRPIASSGFPRTRSCLRPTALIDLLHPDDRDAMREWIRAALAGEHPEVLEFRVVLPDGSVRVLSGRGELIFADDNRPVRLVGTVQDVTEQKQAQAALRESEQRYRILLENGFDGIFVYEDFRIVQLNDRLAEMTGYPPAELMGNPVHRHVHPRIAGTRSGNTSAPGRAATSRYELRRPDGRIVEVESFGVPCKVPRARCENRGPPRYHRTQTGGGGPARE